MFERIVEIIAEQLGLEDTSHITPSTSLLEDLDADSLDAVEIIMALEDEYGVEIPDEEVEKFRDINDIIKYIEANR